MDRRIYLQNGLFMLYKCVHCLACPAILSSSSSTKGYYVLLLFLIFNDSCQTSYLKIYLTDLRQKFRVGRIVAVDNQSKISFLPRDAMHALY